MTSQQHLIAVNAMTKILENLSSVKDPTIRYATFAQINRMTFDLGICAFRVSYQHEMDKVRNKQEDIEAELATIEEEDQSNGDYKKENY